MNINTPNITKKERIQDFVRNIYSITVVRPSRVLKLLCNPKIIYGPTYFPDMKRRTNRQILWDQVRNILQYEDIEPYYYLYGCDVKSRREQRMYTPYMKFMRRRNRLNFRSEHNASCILRDKLMFGAVASTLGIPTPRNVGMTNPKDATVFDIVKSQCVTSNDFLESLEGRFFCKPLNGECGNGIISFHISAADNETVIMNGKAVKRGELEDMLLSAEYLIQEQIEQHPVLNQIYPLSVNTIRLTTVRDINDGVVKVFPSVLRVGNLGNTIDNFSQGGVVINIDVNNGKLEKYGFMKSEFGTKVTHHPMTEVEFDKFEIPYFQNAVEEALRFHSYLNLHSIGWDIAITHTGPCFIEGNDNWEIDAQQNALHPLDAVFKEMFYKR